VRIVKIIGISNDAWEEAWKDSPYATFFQSPTWAKIWAREFSGELRTRPQKFFFSDLQKVVLPVVEERLTPGARWRCVLSPGGTYGGWIGCSAIKRDHAVCLTDYLVKLRGGLIWRLNLYDPAVSPDSVPSALSDFTHRIFLDGNAERTNDALRSTFRRGARKARREGVVVRLAEGKEDWAAYENVYRQSLARWGQNATSRYSHRLFQELAGLKHPDIRLWLAVYRNAVAAGAVCFDGPDHVIYWHGAANSDLFHVRPVNLLMTEIASDAAQRGKTWFDLNPSGRHEGVKEFKERMGGVSVPSPVVVIPTPQPHLLFRALGWIRRKLVRTTAV